MAPATLRTNYGHRIGPIRTRWGRRRNRLRELIVFPAQALLIVEERLKEQEAAGVRMPEGMSRNELALRYYRDRANVGG